MLSRWANPREMRIPIAFGHIAAKVWGREDGEKVLALHGWQDNAGTFDTLIPLLKSNLYIVAVDALGHGLSSHKPHGNFYSYFEMILDIRRVLEYLRWDSFSLMGHSLGGTLSLMYASLYPESVRNIVLLDILIPRSKFVQELPGETRKGIDEMLQAEAKIKNPAPVYSRTDARNRLIQAMYNEVTPESADVLMKRGCEVSPCGKGVVFTRDIRIQQIFGLQRMSHEDCKEYMTRLKCNLLIILSSASVFKTISPEVEIEFLNLYEEVAPSVQVVQVEGNHFVHLNYPERVFHHIDLFFDMHNARKSKL